MANQYAIGERMTDEDSLAHYGVVGMKWGKTRAKATGSEIRTARAKLTVQKMAVDKQKSAVRKASTEVGKAKAKAKYAEMNSAYLKNPDRVTAQRLSRGEKVLSVALLGPLGLVAIGASSAASRRIEQKQDTGQYGT